MAQAQDTSIGIPNAEAAPQEFTWATCTGLPDDERIWIKEQAASAGLAFCEQLVSLFEAHNIPQVSDERPALGKQHLQAWSQDLERLNSRHKKFSVLVGVAGATGSGKTSALNALLGYRELLPTSNQEASTAVPCKIAYNDDEDPSQRFRGEVKFRDREDVKKQLGEFYGDMKARQGLRDGESDEHYDALRELEANLKPTLELINTLWGLEQDQVENMSCEDLLDSNPEVSNLFGTTKQFHDSELDTFSDMVKPYMDSTVALHGESGSEFAVWPLVEKVDLFVKSDILRNGLTLVDLPGLADSVESRAAVAEKYFAKLCATLIVCPAPRAADEHTGVKLMSDNQEQRLQMDGKFHKRSFCVVVSQIDRIDPKAALRTKTANDNTRLRDLCDKKPKLVKQHKQMKTSLKGQEKELSKLVSAAKRANKRVSSLNHSENKIHKSSSLTDARKAQTKANVDREAKNDEVIKLSTEIRNVEQEIQEVDSEITFICVQERNLSLEQRFNIDFARRQRHVVTEGLDEAYDGTVQICPISAMAYWGTKEDKPVPGFPSEEYTGVPNLVHWIRSATIAEREHHIMGVLHDLEGLYNRMHTCSREESAQNRVQVDRQWVEATLQNFVENFEVGLQHAWDRLSNSVRKHDPLHRKNEVLKECEQEYVNVVRSWTYKEPSDDTNSAKVGWGTYAANIRKKGQVFVSKSGGKRYTYHWMQDVASILLRTIVADWNKALHRDIPALVEPTADDINATVNDLMIQLEISITSAVPELRSLFLQVRAAMEDVKTQVNDRIGDELRDVSRNATEIHTGLVKFIQPKWAGVFNEASEIRGVGSFAAQKEHLADFAAKTKKTMLYAAFRHLERKVQNHLKSFHDRLQNISEYAKKSIQADIAVLLDSVILPTTTQHQHDATSEKLALQQDIRDVLLDWNVAWKAPTSNVESIYVAIPETYRHLPECKDEDGDTSMDDEDDDQDIGDEIKRESVKNED